MIKFYKSNAFLWVSVVAGIGLIVLSIWGTFENTNWKVTWETIGKTLFASGIFAGLLKLMQSSGMFKDELEKLIFEPRFLTNRNDLPTYWNKISQELFRNKFPNISKKILDDIRNQYLPTSDVIYYDEQEHYIEIKLESDDLLSINQKTTLTLVSNSTEKFDYEFSNSMNFVESESEVHHECVSFKVNGIEVSNFKHDQKIENNKITNRYVVSLNGQSKYDISRDEIKRYSLLKDDLAFFRALKLTNTLKVTISHPEILAVEFRKMGELNDFTEKRKTNSIQIQEYKGIIYKEQGYCIQFKRKQA